jgi:hypothetical protein
VANCYSSSTSTKEKRGGMIINPLVAAASIAASAVSNFFPGDWMGRRISRHPDSYFQQQRHDDEPFRLSNKAADSDRQFYSVEDELNDQSREFDAFTMPYTPIIFQDAEILSKKTIQSDTKKQNRPPPLLNTNNPWKLLGIDTGASFDDVRHAYKQMTKIYHPDAVVGPDATIDERRDANEVFSRINTAFEFLKRKESEEVYEYSMYIDGERVTRSVVVDPDECQQMDPYRINYDRIIEMSEYRKHHPQTKMWYEAENDYHQRHNGFVTYSDSAHSKGKWWHTRRFEQRNDDGGTIPSNSKLWDNQKHDDEQHVARSSGGFGFIRSQDRWWDEVSSFEYEGSNNNHDYQMKNNNKFRSTKNGYPYKDKIWSKVESSAVVPHKPIVSTEFDSIRQESYPPEDKWWKGNESVFGEFSP